MSEVTRASIIALLLALTGTPGIIADEAREAGAHLEKNWMP